jgi:hypothetical protein
MLDCRAPEWEIFGHALHSAHKAKAMLYAIPTQYEWGGIPADEAQVERALDELAIAQQARPVAEGVSLAGRMARMMDAGWWNRNLRRELLRENEELEHYYGALRRARQVYVSDYAVNVKAERAKTNRRTLENLEVVSDQGDALNLAEVSDKSISNPALRRAELMVRCRGFEECAEYMGHQAFFLTLTTPSRFHRFNGAGKDNKKWTEETPRDSQKYLCKQWAKIRAAWKRQGFTPYGFRVAEPHHDGCAHWHILLFAPVDHVGWFSAEKMAAGVAKCGAGIVGIAGRYALQESPSERGAIKHRFTCKLIDASKGSATGYIAKYIAKNIDGLNEAGDNVGLDFDSGTAANQAAKRVKTWAQTWSIRQFQQVGGPSVTVWRELRRLGPVELEQGQTPDMFTAPQNAACDSNWSVFWLTQGGPNVPKKEQSLKPFYIDGAANKYGEDTDRLYGVVSLDNLTLKTRTKEWVIQRAGTNDNDLQHAAHMDDVYIKAAHKRAFGEFTGRVATAWTGINNCTGNELPQFDFSKFEPEVKTIDPDAEYIDGETGEIMGQIDGIPYRGATIEGELEVQVADYFQAQDDERRVNASIDTAALFAAYQRGFARTNHERAIQ